MDLKNSQFLSGPNNDKILRKKCLIVLRKTCGQCGILPTSCVLSEGLAKTDDHPFGRGGFADIWPGTYNDCEVAIKALRIYQTSDLVRIKKVSFWILKYFALLRHNAAALL